MLRFKLTLEDQAILYYEPNTSQLITDNGEPVSLGLVQSNYIKQSAQAAFRTHPDKAAGKSRKPKVLKISLGFACNFSCSYCSQSDSKAEKEVRFDRAAADQYLAQLWIQFGLQDDKVTFEFWGGEPLVYWEKLKYMAEVIRGRLPQATFKVITNGTLLSDQKIEDLDRLQFHVAISHDGPGYHIRGKDPLDDPKLNQMILRLAERLVPLNRFSFNCVLTETNYSTKDIYDYIAKKLGYPHFILYTEGVVSVYSESAKSFALKSAEKMMQISERVYRDIFDSDQYGRSHLSLNNTFQFLLKDFYKSISEARPASALGQKCGMDREDNIAIDMQGNVLTCQNTSASSGHKIGQLSKLSDVRLTTAKHWSYHENCQNCPVLQICKGSCMYLDGHDRRPTCDAHFAFSFGIFAAAIQKLTGKALRKIEGDRIRIQNLQSLNFDSQN